MGSLVFIFLKKMKGKSKQKPTQKQYNKSKRCIFIFFKQFLFCKDISAFFKKKSKQALKTSFS